MLDLIEGGFQARKERSDLIHAYAMSAINLYGVIAKDDLLKIFNMQNRPALTEEDWTSSCSGKSPGSAAMCYWGLRSPARRFPTISIETFRIFCPGRQ